VPTWPAVVLSFFLFTHIYGWLAWPRRREAYAQAERLNRQLAEAAGLTVDDEHPGSASESSQHHDRWASS
jgi:hypothetical protein